jgi:hypothetical protein
MKMPKTLLNVFETFCDDLPETVRDDLQFMMVMLSDEDLTVDEVGNIDERARALFGARTFIGRIGNLITAVSIFDVYFALDPGQRFGLDDSPRESDRPESNPNQSVIRGRYSNRSKAILAAKQKWIELRHTTLSPEAIATALTPIKPTPHGEHFASR